jgi:hypothetical protein
MSASGKRKAKFKVGQVVTVRRTGDIVRLVKRDVVLPQLWFHCSDGFKRRVTGLRPLTRRERG